MFRNLSFFLPKEKASRHNSIKGNRVAHLYTSNSSLNKTTMEIVSVKNVNEKKRHLQTRSRAGNLRTVYEDLSNSDLITAPLN